jgi:ABC-type transport system involved in cytochrome c biogenesis ATPase subunit
MDLAIQTRGLSTWFKGVDALKSLNLEVKPISIFAVLGLNYAGKTTSVKWLLGLIRLTGGAAQVVGPDVGRDAIAIRARLGYLSQDPRYFEHMTTREILHYTARFFFRGPQGESERRVVAILDLVGVADHGKADRPSEGFSRYLILTQAAKQPSPPLGYVASFGFPWANLLFCSGLLLMQGALFRHRVRVIGIRLAFISGRRHAVGRRIAMGAGSATRQHPVPRRGNHPDDGCPAGSQWSVDHCVGADEGASGHRCVGVSTDGAFGWLSDGLSACRTSQPKSVCGDTQLREGHHPAPSA